jgi:hypothetical protein
LVKKRSQATHVKRYRLLVAALAGAATVWLAFWLSRSVLPQVWFIPWEASALTILALVLVTGAVVARRGHQLETVALLAGSGGAWAVHEAYPLSICQFLGFQYTPCTATEIGSMTLPPIILIIAAVGLLTSALRMRRSP